MLLGVFKGHCCGKSENAAAVGNHVHEGTTLCMIFSVTNYLEIHNVISTYYISHSLPTYVKLVVWIL